MLNATGEPLGKESTLNIIQTDSQIKNVKTAKQPHRCEMTELLSGFPINEDIPQSLITVRVLAKNEELRKIQDKTLNDWAHSCRMPEKILQL